jgi:hypothetical protein
MNSLLVVRFFTNSSIPPIGIRSIFQKRSKMGIKTPQKEIDLIESRYKLTLAHAHLKCAILDSSEVERDGFSIVKKKEKSLQRLKTV